MPTDMTFTLNPYDMLVWAVVGLIAGVVASRLVLQQGLGLIREMMLGVVGAVVGNLLLGYLHVTITVIGYPIISQIVVAFLGALILVLAIRLGGGLGRGRSRAGVQGPPS